MNPTLTVFYCCFRAQKIDIKTMKLVQECTKSIIGCYDYNKVVFCPSNVRLWECIASMLLPLDAV